MAGNADLRNRDFERGLIERVAEAVESDPGLKNQYRSICLAQWFGFSLQCCVLLALIPSWFGISAVLKAKGDLNPVILMSVNIAGTFLPLCVLGGLWRLSMTGPDTMVALPRMPISDEQSFVRAWRKHAVWAWRGAFIVWLLIYAEMLWFERRWDWNAGVWMFVMAGLQACISMALCSFVSLFNHAFKGWLIQLHVFWGIVACAAMFTAAESEKLMDRYPGMAEEVNAWLPARVGTHALVESMSGELAFVTPLIWLVLAAFVVHWVSGLIHRRLHSLARIGERRPTPDSTVESKSGDLTDWRIEDEHKKFWSRRGPLEQALWGLTTRRERLALEGIANERLSLTLQWLTTLFAVCALMGGAWGLHLLGSNWSLLPVLCAGCVSFIFVIVPPVFAQQRFGGNMTVSQNPFPFLPVSAKEVYLAWIKAIVVKVGFASAHMLVFVTYLVGTAGPLRRAWVGYHAELMGGLWILAVSLGMLAALLPIMMQSNVISLLRVKGWIAIFGYLFVFAAPLAVIGVLVGLRASGWLLVIVPFVVIAGSAHLTFWMWREGTYDFSGIPLMSKGVEKVSSSNYSETKSID